MINRKAFFNITLNLFIGFGLSLIALEIIARILPARDSFVLDTPIECDDLNEINLNCLHRRPSYISGRLTKGKFPPFPVDAFKKTNDIGQFSNIDIKDFINNESKKIRILTIGDSQVEALQVDNNESFHGLFNNDNELFISTAIGSSGMALPNYLSSLKYVLSMTSLKNDFLIISIQPNDFDESFEKYGVKGRRLGRGQFFFGENEDIYFKEFIENNSAEKFINFTLKNSSLARYFTYNFPLLHRIKSLKVYCLVNNNASQCNKDLYNHAANVIDESYEGNPERYNFAYTASDIFLKKLSILRKSNKERIRTIILVDADRGFIKGEYQERGVFFEAQRNNLIKRSKDIGFTVIDLENSFRERYKKGASLNSIVDGHWDESGHKAAYGEILKFINEIIKK